MSLCPFDISFGVGASSIGLSQISSFLSLLQRHSHVYYNQKLNGSTDGTVTGTSLAKEAIRKNYTKVQQGLGNPLDVVDYLYSDIDPPLLTESMREDIKVEYIQTFICCP